MKAVEDAAEVAHNWWRFGDSKSEEGTAGRVATLTNLGYPQFRRRAAPCRCGDGCSVAVGGTVPEDLFGRRHFHPFGVLSDR
jgi:hypothetical protein